MVKKVLTPEEIAYYAAHHSFEKHILKGNKFTDSSLGPVQNVHTKQDLIDHTLKTLSDKRTMAFIADNNRKLYYNAHTNTAIWQNDLDPKNCSCFRPERNYFRDMTKRECKRMKIEFDEKLIRRGGYESVHIGSKTHKKSHLHNKSDIKQTLNKTHNNAKIENDRKKAQIEALQKKREQDAKIKLEAQKNKQANQDKQQQAKIDRAKEQAKRDDLKNKKDKALQEEQEKQREREARLKALEEARRKALEKAFQENKKDITKSI